jgi:hypothetical protein
VRIGVLGISHRAGKGYITELVLQGNCLNGRCINSRESLLALAEAENSAQLPQVSEWNGECGPQKAACSGSFPCCSVNGKCGCTALHCGAGCQIGFGTCGRSSATITVTDGGMNGSDLDSGDPAGSEAMSESAHGETEHTSSDRQAATPVASAAPSGICGDPWIVGAVAETNRLRANVGAQSLKCDETASLVASRWSQDMCMYAFAPVTVTHLLTHDESRGECCFSRKRCHWCYGWSRTKGD